MDWQTLRNQFMRTIGGDPPGANLEDELIHAYTNHPGAVERSIEKITLAHQAGKIRSPWGALKAEVAKAVDAARNPTHDTGTQREARIQRAEQWIRNAGIHIDRISEIEHDLFGNAHIEPTLAKDGTPIISAGQNHLLGNHQTNHQLRERLIDHWRELRPIGEQLEQEAEARAARYVQQRDELQHALKHARIVAQAGNLQPAITTTETHDDDIPL